MRCEPHHSDSGMSVNTIYAMAFTLLTVAVVTEDDARRILESATTLDPMTVAYLSIGPGMIGGLAMQFYGGKEKTRKQFSGEIMLSGLAGLLTGAYGSSLFEGVLQLGAASCLAGAAGSGLIVVLIEKIRDKGSEFLDFILGRKHDK